MAGRGAARAARVCPRAPASGVRLACRARVCSVRVPYWGARRFCARPRRYADTDRKRKCRGHRRPYSAQCALAGGGDMYAVCAEHSSLHDREPPRATDAHARRARFCIVDGTSRECGVCGVCVATGRSRACRHRDRRDMHRLRLLDSTYRDLLQPRACRRRRTARVDVEGSVFACVCIRRGDTGDTGTTFPTVRLYVCMVQKQLPPQPLFVVDVGVERAGKELREVCFVFGTLGV